MSTHDEVPKSGVELSWRFEEIVGEMPELTQLTADYDTVPRPLATELENKGLPLGHIAFMGDFEEPQQ